jgi:hypothetical protein
LVAVPAFGMAQSKELDEVAALRKKVQTAGKELGSPVPLATPSSSSNVPSAYGGRWGSVGIGFSYQSRTRGKNTNNDGTAGLVLPLGNPSKSIGADLTVNALELRPFGRRGGFNLKLHKVLEDGSSAALGLENFGVWGKTDGDTSLYAVYSRRFSLGESGMALDATAGLGTGRFRRDSDIKADRSAVGLMGSLGLRVHSQASLFGEWNSNSLNAGVSLVPVAELPFVTTLAWQDLNRSGRDRGRFSLGMGMAFFF